MTSRGPRHTSDGPVLSSLLDTSRSTLKMLLEVWYTLWHESHH
jgi:hypothetical protein